MSLFAELKRRNVIRVAVLYIVAAWLAMQIADVGMSTLGLPEWTGKLVLLLLGVGFIPTLVFAWVYELTPEGIKREKDIDRSRSITGETGRKLNIATVVVVVLGVGIVLVDRFLPEKAAEPAGEEASVQMLAALGEANSIAVLPFVNMSGDPENEYFADGLTEELLNVLAKMEGLRVAARTSSFRFKGQVGDMAEIGRQLRVGNVLEGSVRKSGDKIRVTAQLIQVADGFHLWSETYDRKMDDIFVIQDDIASHVGDALKVTLLGEAESEGPASDKPPTTNIDAYTAYLRGQQQLAINSYDSYEVAEGLFKEAIRLDPSFGAAHAGLAKTWAAMTDWGVIPRADSVARVAAEAQRALDIEDRDPLGWTLKAWAEIRRENLSTAERQDAEERAEGYLRRALEIEPGHGDASDLLAALLESNERGEEALHVARAALERDLVSAQARVSVASVLRQLGRLDEARQELEFASQLEPDDPMVANTLAINAEYAGDYAEAIIWSARTAALDPRDPEGPVSVAVDYIAIGDLEAAEAWIRKAEAMDPLVPGTRFGRACLLWSAGRHEEAFEIARAAVEEDLYDRMGSRAGFASMVLAVALERGDYELALKPLERTLDEALDPDAEWTANAPWFTRARVLAVLRARGDGALAQKLGQIQLDWSDSAESALDRSTRLAVRALTFRGLGRVEEALAEYRALRDMGVHPNWRLFFSDPGAWYGWAEDPALLAFREEERAWQAEQRRRLAESGREPPRPVVEPNKGGI